MIIQIILRARQALSLDGGWWRPLDINLIVTFSKGKVPLFLQWSSAQINMKLRD